MRSYVCDLAGGTTTAQVQITQSGTLKRLTASWLSAAAGKIEFSRSSVSQIGTAQPTIDVLGRLNSSATAGNVVAVIELDKTPLRSFKAFDILYIHQTGAGNLGSVSFEI
jgi:hypothetical protein